MNLTYFDTKTDSHLIEEYFSLSFSKEKIPFKSTIIPIASTVITFVNSGNQKAIVNNTELSLEGLIVSGQFFRSYQFLVNSESFSIGLTLHPTALHKLLNINVSKLTNKHVSLSKINPKLHDSLEKLFVDYQNDTTTLFLELNKFILKLPINENNNTKYIDDLIKIIREKEGMLSVDELLKKVPYGQKTLENHFKNIVGLTPGKYIRLFRFLKLMRKYESHEIDIKDLIYMYDYYDQSHFSRDFALFMKESPKDYFKKSYPLLKKVLKK